ncbi:MAG: CPBP family intramembrane glutamic endopeptidase [Gammaproteobacteria bacterium]
MRAILAALTPAAILLTAICISGFLSYLSVVLVVGDHIALRKIISKTTLVLLLFAIIPAMRYLSLSKEDIGFSGKYVFFKQISQGLTGGVLILAPVIGLLIYLGLWNFDEFRSWTALNIFLTPIGLLMIAFLVAVPEEIIFRGILQTSLSRKLGLAAGVFLSAFYYAGLHFLKTHRKIPLEEIDWTSSFVLIADAFSNLPRAENLSAFIALFCVGVFLSCVRIRLPQSLGICIGLHAGWVFLIKMTSTVFNRDRDSEWVFLVNQYDGIIGPLVAFWLILLTLAFLYYFPDRRPGADSHSGRRNETKLFKPGR